MAVKKTDLQPVDANKQQALARPDFVKSGRGGQENLTRDDIAVARLAIAQALSPQLKEGDPAYIADLRQGQMFNSVTGRIYGKGPIPFTVIRLDKPRYIEFNPREEGGGIKDMNVPPGDPRRDFTTDEQGNRIKPIATCFREYAIILNPNTVRLERSALLEAMIMLSCKGSQLKVAKNQLNTFIHGRDADVWNGVYTVEVVPEKGKLGDFFNYRFANAGWLESKERSDLFGAFAESMKDTEFKVDREAGADDDTDFDTSKM